MTLDGYFEGRRYPGRVIIIGNTREGRSAIAYAIMGRTPSWDAVRPAATARLSSTTRGR